MDFSLKKPVHILALIFLVISFLVIILLPVFSFFGYFGASEAEIGQQIEEMPEFARLVFEIIIVIMQFALVIFLMVLVPILWYIMVNKYNFKNILKALMLKKKNIKKSLFYGIISVGLIFFVLIILNFIFEIAGADSDKLGNVEEISKFFSPVTLFILISFQPIPEEIFFRGFLLDKFNFLYGKEIAVILTSLLFGLAHLTYQNFFPALSIVFIGLILGFLVLKTRNLFSAIFAHILFNVTSFILFYIT